VEMKCPRCGERATLWVGNRRGERLALCSTHARELADSMVASVVWGVEEGEGFS
jgi:hypothetical protein